MYIKRINKAKLNKMQTNQPTPQAVMKYINGYMTSIMFNNEYQYLSLRVLAKEPFYRAHATKPFRLYVNELLKRASANRMDAIKHFPEAHNSLKEFFADDENALQANSVMSMFLHLPKEKKDLVEEYVTKLLESQ